MWSCLRQRNSFAQKQNFILISMFLCFNAIHEKKVCPWLKFQKMFMRILFSKFELKQEYNVNDAESCKNAKATRKRIKYEWHANSICRWYKWLQNGQNQHIFYAVNGPTAWTWSTFNTTLSIPHHTCTEIILLPQIIYWYACGICNALQITTVTCWVWGPFISHHDDITNCQCRKPHREGTRNSNVQHFQFGRNEERFWIVIAIICRMLAMAYTCW